MRVRALALIVLIFAVVAATTVSASAAGRVYFVNCAGKARYKPKTVVVFCGDAGLVVKRIKWYRWGAGSARGRSRYAFANDCTPTCADGKFHRYRTRLVLNRVRTCASGRKIFTRMYTIFGRHHPPGLRKIKQRQTCGS